MWNLAGMRKKALFLVVLLHAFPTTFFLNGAPFYARERFGWGLGANSLAQARKSHTSTLLQSNQVLITGGKTAAGDSKTAELYDPATAQFSSTGSMIGVRSLHAASAKPNSRSKSRQVFRRRVGLRDCTELRRGV